MSGHQTGDAGIPRLPQRSDVHDPNGPPITLMVRPDEGREREAHPLESPAAELCLQRRISCGKKKRIRGRSLSAVGSHQPTLMPEKGEGMWWTHGTYKINVCVCVSRSGHVMLCCYHLGHVMLCPYHIGHVSRVTCYVRLCNHACFSVL